MQIQHRQSNSRGTFFVEENGTTIAKMLYTSPSDSVMVIEHTEVTEDEQGKDIGKKLVEHAINYARQHHMKIDPQCPFVKAIVERQPEYQDVII